MLKFVASLVRKAAADFSRYQNHQAAVINGNHYIFLERPRDVAKMIERLLVGVAPERNALKRGQSPTKCGSSVMSISSIGSAAIRSSESWLTGMNDRRWCGVTPCIASSCMCASVE